MNLTNIKFVAADMDGTLLNAKHELSPDFYPVFDQLRSKGILFAVASGRQYFNLKNRFEAIEEDVIFIAENGSYVVHRGIDILVQAMTTETVRSQLSVIKNIPAAYPILCGKNAAYVESTEPAFIENVELYYDKYEVVDDLLAVENDEFLKIAICDLIGSESNSYQYFRDKQDELQVKISGSIWLDLSHKLANKGRAINVIQKKYGVTKAETMAFGDYLNDLEMMQEAGFSFAMENAHPEIKRVSRYLAKSNEEDGVIAVLQQMLQAMNGNVVTGIL